MKAQLFVIELSDEARRPSKRRAGAVTVREISSPSSAISHSRGHNGGIYDMWYICNHLHVVYATIPPQGRWRHSLARTVNRSTVQLGEMQ
jgi:hypothetical protein